MLVLYHSLENIKTQEKENVIEKHFIRKTNLLEKYYNELNVELLNKDKRYKERQ